MSEKFFQQKNITAVFKHICRKGMAKRMIVNRLVIERKLLDILIKPLVNGSCSDMSVFFFSGEEIVIRFVQQPVFPQRIKTSL